MIFCSCSLWIKLKAFSYLLRDHDISLHNFWSRNKETLNIWVTEAKHLFFRSFYVKPNYEHCKEDTPALNMWFFHQEQKFRICIISRRFIETKIVQIQVFPKIFIGGNWITKKYLFSVFSLKICPTKIC